jgi:hypothetical protein
MSSRTLAFSALAALALSAVSGTANAQLGAGGGIAGDILYYDLVSTDGSDSLLGQLVVTDPAATDLPYGMKPGTEYWMFADTALPKSFAAVPLYGILPDTIMVPHGELPSTVADASSLSAGDLVPTSWLSPDELLPESIMDGAKLLPDSIMIPGLTTQTPQLRFDLSDPHPLESISVPSPADTSSAVPVGGQPQRPSAIQRLDRRVQPAAPRLQHRQLQQQVGVGAVQPERAAQRPAALDVDQRRRAAPSKRRRGGEREVAVASAAEPAAKDSASATLASASPLSSSP